MGAEGFWLIATFDRADHFAPTGYHLKQWLFGGQSIATKVALFPLDQYPGLIVADLFGEDSYFADSDPFWALQNQDIAAKLLTKISRFARERRCDGVILWVTNVWLQSRKNLGDLDHISCTRAALADCALVPDDYDFPGFLGHFEGTKHHLLAEIEHERGSKRKA